MAADDEDDAPSDLLLDACAHREWLAAQHDDDSPVSDLEFRIVLDSIFERAARMKIDPMILINREFADNIKALGLEAIATKPKRRGPRRSTKDNKK